MRCDVCDTKIPPGADRCPNCGYRVRGSSNITHSQTISTNYPEPEIFKPKTIKEVLSITQSNIGSFFATNKNHELLKNILFLL